MSPIIGVVKIRLVSTGLIFAAGLCLSQSGCLFRRSNIDGLEEHQLSYDRAEVDSTQKGYRDSVDENGPYSGQAMKAGTDLNDAQQKLRTDQRQYDDYLSASGQSAEPRQ